MDANPYLAGLGAMRAEIERLAGDPLVVQRVDALPNAAQERVDAVRKISPQDLSPEPIESGTFRVSARWFEDAANPAPDLRFKVGASDARGVAAAVLKRPTVCASVGWVLCATVGD